MGRGGNGKCRHVTQALHLQDLRRALKKQEMLLCELCVVPSVSGNHRAKPTKRGVKSPVSPVTTIPSPVRDDVEQKPVEETTTLCVCVTCGFVGCWSKGHFNQHFQCSPCGHEVETAGKPKLDAALRDCQTVIEEITAKQQRRIKGRFPQSPYISSISSTSSDMAIDIGEDGTANEACSVDSLQEGGATSSRRGQKHKDSLDMEEASTSRRGAKDKGLAMNEQEKGDATSSKNGETSVTSRVKREEKLRRKQSKSAEKMSSTSLNAENIPDISTIVPMENVHSVVGFTNVGNTCYFNAAMQALLTAVHYFPEHIHFHDILELSNVPITSTFTMLYETVKKRARTRLTKAATEAGILPAEEDTPTKIKDKKRQGGAKAKSSKSDILTVSPLLKEIRTKFSQFRGNYQQDAHEVFVSFLWGIDDEIDPPPMPLSTDRESGPQSPLNPLEDDEERDDIEQHKQIFVKTDIGETISLQVPKDATVKTIQKLIAERLHLNEDDMMLESSSRSDDISSSVRRTTIANMDKMYSKLNLTRSLFGGAVTTVVTCKACGNRSETTEDAFQLSVSIPESSSPNKPVSAMDCLKEFMRETELLVAANNGYDCEKCSRLQTERTNSKSSRLDGQKESVLRDALMQLFISRLPRVLVIHMKRLARMKKITQHIQFDSLLDMQSFVEESNRNRTLKDCAGQPLPYYELIAVVVHVGNKRSGHYVAYVSRSRRKEAKIIQENRKARSPQPQEQDSDDDFDPRAEIHTSETPSRSWYFVSDTVVKRVSLEQVLQCEAYMLFYQQLPPSRS